ncbi:MAG TPA: stage II sporulation protein P, partial [Bacillota bacterium]|nr:stage II sporulation protein P [Bacillota bacterium]
MKKLQLSISIFGILLFSVSMAALGQVELDKQFFVLKDAGGKIICRTAHRVVPGDRYLNSENRLYEVIKVSKTVALVKPVKEAAAKRKTLFSQAVSSLTDLWKARTAAKARGPVCIYHTHTDEAYLPTEGVNSKKVRGGIVDVGEAVAKAFEEQGVPVVHSKASHVPHDAMAY